MTALTFRNLTSLLSVLLLASPAPVLASEAIEREQLATLVLQLDLIDRLANHAATAEPQHRARYHFDYTRLQEDIERIRAGINDYLTPQRAQPRDPIELLGDYRQPDRPSDEEGSQ